MTSSAFRLQRLPLGWELTCAADEHAHRCHPWMPCFWRALLNSGQGGSPTTEEAEAPFPSRMGSVWFSVQHCVGLLIGNWSESKPASAQGCLLLLRDELYLE